MQIASCQAFALLVMVGILMFFTSFLTLDFHTSIADLQKRTGHEFFHLPRGKAVNIQLTHEEFSVGSPLKLPSTVDKGVKFVNNYNGAHDTHEVLTLHEDELMKSIEEKAAEAAAEAQALHKSPAAASKPKSTSCSVTFKPTCRINPLVKYWDEVMECYTSPLRKYQGLNAPLKEQRFVVFQPDSGGWNNIRMALEVVILFAQVTGRILVLPPNAVLYLLHMNKKWKDNKSGMEDYFDFDKLRASGGLETMPMNVFLKTVAMGGLLNAPLPNNDTELLRQPLWDYLQASCYSQAWSPGKIYIGFNISMETETTPDSVSSAQEKLSVSELAEKYVGTFESTDPARLDEFSLKQKRTLLPFDAAMHAQRAIYFPGAEPNRLLTHFYSMLFFATVQEDRRAKRFMRDRLRYHDQIFCTGSELVEKILKLEALLAEHIEQIQEKKGQAESDYIVDPTVAARILKQMETSVADSAHGALNSALADTEFADVRSGQVLPSYVAFHIRRGDFQQKHTRLPAEQIVSLTNHLVPDRHTKIAYISTDEGNRSFFEPFVREYAAVYFLADLKNGTDIDEINQNYVGMIEQVVCANADVFIGTPLSTFTAYITRMRGFMNRTISTMPSISAHSDGHRGSAGSVRVPAGVNRAGLYSRTYYFMNHHMHMLHTKPHVHFPLWIRDFVDVFENIDDDGLIN